MRCAALLLVAVAAACDPPVQPQGCSDDDECAIGERCDDGLCAATACGPLRAGPRCVDDVVEVCRGGGDADERVVRFDCGALGASCVDGACADLPPGSTCDDVRTCAGGLTCDPQGDGSSLCALPQGAACVADPFAVLPCAGDGVGCFYDDEKSHSVCAEAELTCSRDDPAEEFAPRCAGSSLVVDCLHGDQPYGFACDVFDGTCVEDACVDVRPAAPCDDEQLFCDARGACTQVPSGARLCATADDASCFVDSRDGVAIVAPCAAPGSACALTPQGTYRGDYTCLPGVGSCLPSPTGNEPPACQGSVLQQNCLYGGVVSGFDCAGYGGACAADRCVGLRAAAPCGASLSCASPLVCGADSALGDACQVPAGGDCFGDVGFGGAFLPCDGVGAGCVFDGNGDVCRAGLPACGADDATFCANARYLYTDCVLDQPRAIDCQGVGGTCTGDRCVDVDVGRPCGLGILVCANGLNCVGEDANNSVPGTCTQP